MPRTELPSGNWVEWKTDLMSGTRFAVKSAVVHEISGTPGGNEVVQRSDGANEDRQRLALWAEIITAWSWSEKGIPIPSQNVGGPEVIWTVLDLDDFDKLAEDTQDLLDKVLSSPTRRRAANGSSATSLRTSTGRGRTPPGHRR